MLNQSLDKEGEDGSSSFSANVLCRRGDSDSDPEFAIPINIHVTGLSTIYVCIIFCETKQKGMQSYCGYYLVSFARDEAEKLSNLLKNNNSYIRQGSC